MVVVLAAGCALPSDQAGKVRLTIDQPANVYVGDTVKLSVHAADPAVCERGPAE